MCGSADVAAQEAAVEGQREHTIVLCPMIIVPSPKDSFGSVFGRWH